MLERICSALPNVNPGLLFDWVSYSLTRNQVDRVQLDTDGNFEALKEESLLAKISINPQRSKDVLARVAGRHWNGTFGYVEGCYRFKELGCERRLLWNICSDLKDISFRQLTLQAVRSLDRTPALLTENVYAALETNISRRVILDGKVGEIFYENKDGTLSKQVSTKRHVSRAAQMIREDFESWGNIRNESAINYLSVGKQKIPFALTILPSRKQFIIAPLIERYPRDRQQTRPNELAAIKEDFEAPRSAADFIGVESAVSSFLNTTEHNSWSNHYKAVVFHPKRGCICVFGIETAEFAQEIQQMLAAQFLDFAIELIAPKSDKNKFSVNVRAL